MFYILILLYSSHHQLSWCGFIQYMFSEDTTDWFKSKLRPWSQAVGIYWERNIFIIYMYSRSDLTFVCCTERLDFLLQRGVVHKILCHLRNEVFFIILYCCISTHRHDHWVELEVRAFRSPIKCVTV